MSAVVDAAAAAPEQQFRRAGDRNRPIAITDEFLEDMADSIAAEIVKVRKALRAEFDGKLAALRAELLAVHGG